MYGERLRNFFRLAHMPVYSYGDRSFSVTPKIITELRSLDYDDQWRVALSEGWYHVLMEDLSLFLFNDGDGSSSFSYIECPLQVPSFREYLCGKGIEYNSRSIEEYRDEYDIVVLTSSRKRHVTPIRYDRDPAGYKSGFHPYAHIHIGLNNSVRLGLEREMTVSAFALFVMRQSYPRSWERLLGKVEGSQLERAVRASCAKVCEKYFSGLDGLELCLR